MRFDFFEWRKSWEKLKPFEKDIKDILIKKGPSVGFPDSYFDAFVLINYNEGNILINQGAATNSNNEASLSSLSYIYEVKNETDLYIYLNPKDFFDLLSLNWRIKMNNRIFDKKFTVKSSDETIARKLFQNTVIQNIFLDNPFLVFNVKTKNNTTRFLFKDMRNKFYSPLEVKKSLNDFKLILDIVL